MKRLPKPVISVGNITTGGTGKTPIVCWLCRHLRHLGHRPAVLMRGYKARPGELSDEQAMLKSLLATSASPTGIPHSKPDPSSFSHDPPGSATADAPHPVSADAPVIIKANPNRCRGGLEVLKEDESVSIFVLDDGFQHRRLARDFDFVLIDALNPFGFGHVLPRGLLREPIAGLARADALLVTHADQVSADQLKGLIARLKEYNADAPIYCCSHKHSVLRLADNSSSPLANLAGKRFFAFAGIGHPESLHQQLAGLPGSLAGTHWFGDHHNYTSDDLKSLFTGARETRANLLLTTEKDWVKVAPILREMGVSQLAQGDDLASGQDEILPIARLELTIAFAESDEMELLSDVAQSIGK